MTILAADSTAVQTTMPVMVQKQNQTYTVGPHERLRQYGFRILCFGVQLAGDFGLGTDMAGSPSPHQPSIGCDDVQLEEKIASSHNGKTGNHTHVLERLAA